MVYQDLIILFHGLLICAHCFWLLFSVYGNTLFFNYSMFPSNELHTFIFHLNWEMRLDLKDICCIISGAVICFVRFVSWSALLFDFNMLFWSSSFQFFFFLCVCGTATSTTTYAVKSYKAGFGEGIVYADLTASWRQRGCFWRSLAQTYLPQVKEEKKIDIE